MREMESDKIINVFKFKPCMSYWKFVSLFQNFQITFFSKIFYIVDELHFVFAVYRQPSISIPLKKRNNHVFVLEYGNLCTNSCSLGRKINDHH